MALSKYYAFSSFFGYTVRFSNDYISITLSNVANCDIQDPYTMDVQRNWKEGITIPYATGINSSVILALTVECPSLQIAELGWEFERWREEEIMDVIGTVEVVLPDGNVVTYNDAILQKNPISRSISYSAENPSYNINFSVLQGIK